MAAANCRPSAGYTAGSLHAAVSIGRKERNGIVVARCPRTDTDCSGGTGLCKRGLAVDFATTVGTADTEPDGTVVNGLRKAGGFADIHHAVGLGYFVSRRDERSVVGVGILLRTGEFPRPMVEVLYRPVPGCRVATPLMAKRILTADPAAKSFTGMMNSK